MNTSDRNIIFLKIIRSRLSVDEIKLAVEAIDNTDIALIKRAVIMSRARLLPANDGDEINYHNLVIRVLTDVSRPSPVRSSIIVDKSLSMVPVSWVDDGTADAAQNENMKRWIELKMVTTEHVESAKLSQSKALHFFEPLAINRRTAHVTTESFLKLMGVES